MCRKANPLPKSTFFGPRLAAAPAPVGSGRSQLSRRSLVTLAVALCAS